MNGPDSSFPGYLSSLEVPCKPGAVGAEDMLLRARQDKGMRGRGQVIGRISVGYDVEKGGFDWPDNIIVLKLGMNS